MMKMIQGMAMEMKKTMKMKMKVKKEMTRKEWHLEAQSQIDWKVPKTNPNLQNDETSRKFVKGAN